MAKKSRESGSSYSYFKQLFIDEPSLLKVKSNQALLARYRSDHGLAEDTPVEKKVMNNLANLKSVMKSRSRKAAKRAGTPFVKSANKLEALEIAIDHCLTQARVLDPEGLKEVIQHLRAARNKVVWKLGEK
jgi:two-component sensor histidine kinase